jgi:uncharacterized protein
MIDRKIKNELIELLQQFPAVAIVGPRQVGKTTLAKSLLSENKSTESIYLDLENSRDEIKLTDPMLFFENNINYCIILDEIQRRKDLFPILRSAIDLKRNPSRFILLGSASPDLIRDSSETLAGRIVFIELQPLNLLEIYEKYTVNEHISYGGFPDSIQAGSGIKSLRWRNAFIKSYVERDLPLLGLPLNPRESYRLISMIAHLHSQILNYSSISNSMGISVPSVKKYLDFLENAYLINLLQPFSANKGKRLIKSPKIYIRDSGILNALHSIRDFTDLIEHPIVGACWEGYVIEQIKQILPENHLLTYYRTQHGAEVDLIISKGEKPIMGIEIKFSSAPVLSKGVYEVIKDLKLSKLFVVIPTEDSYYLKENIEVLSLKKILEIINRL